MLGGLLIKEFHSRAFVLHGRHGVCLGAVSSSARCISQASTLFATDQVQETHKALKAALWFLSGNLYKSGVSLRARWPCLDSCTIRTRSLGVKML